MSDNIKRQSHFYKNYAHAICDWCINRTAGGVTTTSLYDGGRVILEAQGGTYTETYTYGVSLIRRNEEFFQYDGLGSARTFTNASGVVTAAVTYDGYGNTVGTSGSTSSPYQFGATSGYRNDGDAGIMEVGARYYDPSTGSFLTRDRDLGQLAYVYCWDDPIDKVDPRGHDPSLAHEIYVNCWIALDGYLGCIGGAAIGGLPSVGIGAVPGGIIGGVIGVGAGNYIGEQTWKYIKRADTPSELPPFDYPHPFGYFAE